MLGRQERIETLENAIITFYHVATKVNGLQTKAESDKVKLSSDTPEITVFDLLHISSNEIQKEISKANNRYRLWTTPIIGEIANSLYSVMNALYSVGIQVVNDFIHKDPAAKILLSPFTPKDYFSEAKSLTEAYPSRLELAEEHLKRELTIFDNTIDFSFESNPYINN
jgi:hypothetical protein